MRELLRGQAWLVGRCHHSYFFHLTAAGAPPTHHFLQCSAGARSSKYCSKCTHTEILLLLTDHQLPSRPWQPGFVLFHPSLPWVLTSGPGCSLVAVEKAAAARASVSVACHDQLSVEVGSQHHERRRPAFGGCGPTALQPEGAGWHPP